MGDNEELLDFKHFYENELARNAFWDVAQKILANAPSGLRGKWGAVMDAMAEFEDEINAWEIHAKDDDKGWYNT